MSNPENELEFMKSASGIVLLFDVVDHSKQIQNLGNEICDEALNIFLTKIKSISSKYNFTWIKDIRDAGLFIGNDPIEAVHFYQEALEQFPISPERKTIHRGFVIKFRLAAHFCSFKAEYNSHQQIIDISGGEIDFLFKDMEKEATAGQMVVSPDFYKQFSADITSKGFGFTPFVARDTTTTLYLLILPVLLSPDILSVSDTTPLLDKMNELKQNVQKIKTLGGLYPDLNMEDQFIELRLTAPVLSEERREEWDIIDFQKYGRQKAQKAEQKDLLKCDEIYERRPHLFIKGIPGVGKTTILKYFCFQGFNSDKYPIFIPCHTIPNIEQWEQDYPYASEKDIKGFLVDLVTSAFIYPGRSYKELTAEEKQTLAKMAETVREWASRGKAIFCLDALDEVTNTSQQKQILNKVELWFKSTPESHIYLTARDHTFFEISEDVLLASVNPLAVDQFQDLGRKFFEGKKKLLQKFNQASVNQQEVVALIANTPLLATLVLVWFKKKGEFARRPTILHFITLFILLRIWDRLKNPDFQKSIDEVFNLTLDPRAIENDKELSSLINALEEVVWHAVQGYREGFVSRFKEDVILNILKQFTTIPAGSSADDLLKNLIEGYFLLRITQAPNFYTFIHLSVLEFLAARRLAKIAEDEFLNRFHEFMTNEGLFPLEILPLFSALSFENLKKAISALEKDDQVSKQLQRDGMGLRILIEAEGFIRDQTDDYRNKILIRSHQSLINDFKAVKDKFLTRFTNYLGENDPGKLKEYASVFNATSRFEDRELLSKLDYSLFEAEPELAASRDTLLEQMVYFRLIEDWKTEKRNLRRKEEKVLPTGLENILQLDSKEYDADDKHFNYYATLIPELVGFFGSPNLRHSAGVTSGVFSGDGKYILSASSDNTLKLRDKETGQEVHTFKGHSARVWSGVFSGDGKYILSASSDKTLKLWDKETGQEVRTFKRHSAEVRSGVFSGDGKYILSASWDNTLKLWDKETGQEVRTFKGHSAEVTSGVFSGDGKYILSASRDKTLKLWDKETGQEVRTFKGHSYEVTSGVFSGDGKYILSASLDNTLKLWDKETGQEVCTFKGHSATVTSGVFSGDGKYILSASSDKTLKLWDKETGQEVRTFKGHSAEVFSGIFSGDGKYILSASWDKTLKLWEVASGECLKTINLPWIPRGIAIHPLKQETILTANLNTTLSLFELKELGD